MVSDGIALRLNETLYNAAEERQLIATAFAPAGALTSRPGLRPGPGGVVSVSGSPEQVTVTPFLGVVTDPEGGSYLVCVPNAVSRQLNARPGSGNSRFDELVVLVRDQDAEVADGVREVQVLLIAGNSQANPTPPAIPAGALGLRRLSVPASGPVGLTNAAPFTVAAGGILPVSSAAERNALPVGIDVVRRLDLDGVLERRVGSTTGWTSLVPAVAVAPEISLVATAAQNIGDAGAATTIVFPAPEYITGTTEDPHFTVANGVVTVKKPGRYDISFAGSFAGNAAGRRTIGLMKNNVAARRIAQAPNDLTLAFGETITIPIAAGDQILMQQFQSSGQVLPTVVDSGYAPRLTLKRRT